MKVSSHGFWRSSTRCSRSHCRWDTIICSAGGRSVTLLRMRCIIIIIIINCICVQWVAMVFLVYREGMQLPLVAMVLREASALMRISSIYI